ncbi:hypothetical protein X773_28320 [Mesorhizobium sp. LSJC285A00]|nr:hypothetical protein X773_28320 [Mesorhizobium sp. LSJC285A00]
MLEISYREAKHMKRRTALTALLVSLGTIGLILLGIGLLASAGILAEKGTWPHIVGGFTAVLMMPIAFVAFLSCMFSVLTTLLFAALPREKLIPYLRAWPFKFLLWKEVREEFEPTSS